MNRRDFLRLTVTASAALPLIATRAEEAGAPSLLAGHRVAALETESVQLRWPRHAGRNAKLDAHGFGPTVKVAILKTDQGAIGWGELPGRLPHLDSLRELVVGKPMTDLFTVNSGIRQPELKPLDLALHDLAGVILGQPIWRILGASTPQLFPVYSGMIYFDDLYPPENPAGIDQVLKNCAADRDYGYRQLKVKIGRGNKWMSPSAGLQRDIDVVRAIARAFPDCELLVDGNDGFTADSFINVLKGIEGIPLFWIEEPFVENEAAWRQVHAWTQANHRETTLLADGEQGNDFPLLEKLEAEGILQVRLNDIHGYGFTPWRSLMSKLRATGTLASPHCWGSGLKTVYTAHLVAALGNCATIEGVTCSDQYVDFGDNVIRDGRMQVSTQPGFGLTLRSL
jgi:L-alanine-DL-glutamate epimerase-like enolase superfamily enzyme